MSNNKVRFVEVSKRSGASVMLAVSMAGTGLTAFAAHCPRQATAGGEKQMTATQHKFYCNIKALGPAERARHKQLSEKLGAERRAIVEADKGYEFQFSPTTVSVAELAEWVVAESKCCPFFDFHIDLEREGTLLCLRLTGEEGIKTFIRAEIGLDATLGK